MKAAVALGPPYSSHPSLVRVFVPTDVTVTQHDLVDPPSDRKGLAGFTDRKKTIRSGFSEYCLILKHSHPIERSKSLREGANDAMVRGLSRVKWSEKRPPSSRYRLKAVKIRCSLSSLLPIDVHRSEIQDEALAFAVRDAA